MVVNRDASYQMVGTGETKPEPEYNGAVLKIIGSTNEWYQYYDKDFGPSTAYDAAKWFLQE